MKRLIVAAAGTFALMAGSAYAGEGCSYGKHAASDASEAPIMAAVDDSANPELLAKLKLQEEQEALDKLIQAPVIHN